MPDVDSQKPTVQRGTAARKGTVVRWGTPARHGTVTRRDILRSGSGALLGMSVPQLVISKAAGAAGDARRACIFLMLVGGPSQLDTFDPKPQAPSDVRGPYRAIKTNVRGIRISEILPRTARQADKFAIVRSVYHTAAGLHDTGHQLTQTGRLREEALEPPNAGAIVSYLCGARAGLPAWVVLPSLIGPTGGDGYHGQSAGVLGPDHGPVVIGPQALRPVLSTCPSTTDEALNPYEYARFCDPSQDKGPRGLKPAAHCCHEIAHGLGAAEPEALRDAYGHNRFGWSCLLARRLIERGVRFVTVNMFCGVLEGTTWDVHGRPPFSSLECYRSGVGPMFDHAYAALLGDLHARGLLSRTLVVATGEFGRTPRINRAGGRDHWPYCWSMLLAGGGVRGGQVIGSSDALGAYPKDRPVTPPELLATVYRCLGIDARQAVPGHDGRPVPLVDPGVRPITELF